MGWAYCGTDDRGRRIGYAIAARCDEKGCHRRIDRGLGYACGGMHGSTEFGCGGYFCGKHLVSGGPDDAPVQLCKRCARACARATSNKRDR